MRLQGRGQPTVVFESGAGVGLGSWTKVQPKVAQFASTVAYDRAGLGESDPGPGPRNARRIADELHTALQKVGAQPPYVLVGHSAGAFYIRLFADAHPDEVAGLVFVDPATEQIHDWFQTNVAEAVKAKVASSKMAPGERAESQAHRETAEQVRSTRFPLDLPTVVLSSARAEPTHLPGFLEALLKSHKELVSKLPNAKHVLTETSGHNIQREQPQLVVQAIQELTEQVRHKKH
jgi:pimeloyl-ACP methyl ester carboxylesterase